MSVLLICEDFFFANKITGTAGALDVEITEADSQENALTAISGNAFALCIVNLATPGLNLAELIAALPEDNRPRVMAFASHVDGDSIQAARDAGCDNVLPRSRFSAELPQILRGVAN